MNEIAASLLLALLRMSLLLTAAALAVQILLKVACPGSARVHRTAWLLALLQGWFWWRLPVSVPCYQPAVVEQVPAAAINVARLSPLPIRIVPTNTENHAAAHFPAIFHPEKVAHPARAAIDTPPPIDRPAAFSWTATIRRNWPAAILGSWAAGMLILTGASIVGYLRFLRCLRPTHSVEEVWVREWEDLLARHQVRTAVPLWATANVGPLLCRVPRGYRLVVPAPLWQQLAPAGRLSILRHELAHLQRRDLLKSLFVRLLMLPQWFNPLAWMALRRFDEAAEWACDEVAKGTDLEGCRDYAAALLQLDAACGPRLSYRAAASGRGLSLRVQRLLSPQVKEDSLMKKTTILGIAAGLALLCLVRFDLVAKEPAAKDRAATASGAAEQPAANQSGKAKTLSAAADALRYLPDGCQGVFWADVATLRKIDPALGKSFGSDFGLPDEDIEHITVTAPVSLSGGDGGFQFFRCVGQPASLKGAMQPTATTAVAQIVVAPRVTGLDAKKQIEKSFGPAAWHEETIRGVTLHVQQSKKPIAFFLPAKQTIVIGPAELVRAVLVRGTPVQLSGKLAASWARMDPSHALGLITALPAAGDPARAFLPDDLCNGCEAVLVEADLVAGKDVHFRCCVPCVDAGIAYEVRGLCATYVKITVTEIPQLANAGKSFQFAVNDRCFVFQGKVPVSIFRDDFKAPTRPTPAAGYTVRNFLPDDLCDGVKGFQFEADMPAGKDLHLRCCVPCVDAGVAYQVRGLCAMFLKFAGTQFPQSNDVTKHLHFAVNDNCLVLQGTLPASIFEDGLGLKTTLRSFVPDDVCDGIKGVGVKADMVAGQDLHFSCSVPCADAGIAYQVRGLFATFFKAASGGGGKTWIDVVMKSCKCLVNDRSFVLQGTVPASMFQEGFNTCGRSMCGLPGPRTPQPPQRTPHQEVLCELSQTYLKGFQTGMMDQANQEEAGRRLLARVRQRGGEFPQDAKLNEAQRMFRDLSEIADQGFLQAAQWQDLDPKQKVDEQRWLRQLKSESESARMLAIYALTALRSKKAVPGILQIAADRKEKDNADREAACRALGILGDLSVVPDLVQLTYHYNRDTRFWAQISLVRLTGENFGRDVAAWRQWWQTRGGKPPIAKEKVVWATSPEMLQIADPKTMETADREILEMARRLSTADGREKR